MSALPIIPKQFHLFQLVKIFISTHNYEKIIAKNLFEFCWKHCLVFLRSGHLWFCVLPWLGKIDFRGERSIPFSGCTRSSSGSTVALFFFYLFLCEEAIFLGSIEPKHIWLRSCHKVRSQWLWSDGSSELESNWLEDQNNLILDVPPGLKNFRPRNLPPADFGYQVSEHMTSVDYAEVAGMMRYGVGHWW